MKKKKSVKYLPKVQRIILEAKQPNASCKLHVQGLGGK